MNIAIFMSFVDCAAQGMTKFGVQTNAFERWELGHTLQVRTRKPLRRDRSRVIAEDVVLGVAVADTTQDLWVSCDDVVCLGESFLSDFPIATQNLGDVCRLVALFVGKQCEVIR